MEKYDSGRPEALMNGVSVSILIPIKIEAANLPRCLASVAWQPLLHWHARLHEVWISTGDETDRRRGQHMARSRMHGPAGVTIGERAVRSERVLLSQKTCRHGPCVQDIRIGRSRPRRKSREKRSLIWAGAHDAGRLARLPSAHERGRGRSRYTAWHA